MKRRLGTLLLVLTATGIYALYSIVPLACTLAPILGREGSCTWWHGSVTRTTTVLGGFPADIYSTASSRSPVLLVHGVNATGKNSPEVRPVAEALAGAGFRVVVPEFERLTKQNVTPQDIDDVAAAFTALGSDAGMICASYGCGPVLLAAGRPETRDHVRFVVALGAYFDMADSLRALVTEPPSPLAYSKWLYMAANTDWIPDSHDREVLLRIGTERQTLPQDKWSPPGDTISAQAKAHVRLFESSTPAEFDARLALLPILKSRMEQLSPSLHMSGIRAHLFLLHINSDPCISSAESVRLAQAAEKLHIPTTLTLFNAYGHTRPDWPPLGIRSLIDLYAPEGWKFVNVLREVLNYA